MSPRGSETPTLNYNWVISVFGVHVGAINRLNHVFCRGHAFEGVSENLIYY